MKATTESDQLPTTSKMKREFWKHNIHPITGLRPTISREATMPENTVQRASQLSNCYKNLQV